jgi:hypothetical protein
MQIVVAISDHTLKVELGEAGGCHLRVNPQVMKAFESPSRTINELGSPAPI